MTAEFPMWGYALLAAVPVGVLVVFAGVSWFWARRRSGRDDDVC